MFLYEALLAAVYIRLVVEKKKLHLLRKMFNVRQYPCTSDKLHEFLRSTWNFFFWHTGSFCFRII